MDDEEDDEELEDEEEEEYEDIDPNFRPSKPFPNEPDFNFPFRP